ncbi:hypothetical protein NMY22_g792 [Coprinellus aureogranulatus]|nr:hypothetical protein NMY22_g792 [Coprinellus aureogranulatus]
MYSLASPNIRIILGYRSTSASFPSLPDPDEMASWTAARGAVSTDEKFRSSSCPRNLAPGLSHSCPGSPQAKVDDAVEDGVRETIIQPPTSPSLIIAAFQPANQSTTRAPQLHGKPTLSTLPHLGAFALLLLTQFEVRFNAQPSERSFTTRTNPGPRAVLPPASRNTTASTSSSMICWRFTGPVLVSNIPVSNPVRILCPRNITGNASGIAHPTCTSVGKDAHLSPTFELRVSVKNPSQLSSIQLCPNSSRSLFYYHRYSELLHINQFERPTKLQDRVRPTTARGGSISVLGKTYAARRPRVLGKSLACIQDFAPVPI